MDLFTEITDSQFLPNNRALSLFLAKLYSKFQKILGLVKAGDCHGHTYIETDIQRSLIGQFPSGGLREVRKVFSCFPGRESVNTGQSGLRSGVCLCQSHAL